jgi:hypothetical protein
MKHIILLFFFSFSFLQVNLGQQLVSYQLVQHYDIQDVQAILSSFGIPSTIVAPEFELDYYKVRYTTLNARGTGTTIATGALVVPTGVTCPVPLVSYQHGTTTRKTSVPSYQGGSEYKIGVLASAVFGVVCAMPDYLGLGDEPGFHPYINSRTEASATIDMMRVARELKDTLGFNLNGEVLLFGYSQGGHSTMATFKEIETNLSSEFTVTACAPMSGPYDVAGVQATTITDPKPYATPAYLPYVIMGAQEANGNVYTSLSEIFRAPYDSLLPIYFDGIHSTGWINNQLPDTPSHMLGTTFFNNYLNDQNHFGRVLLREQNVYSWVPIAPLAMYYCEGDEQVFYRNSEVALDTMTALGALNVSATQLGTTLDHTNCAPLAILSAFAFFELHMDLSGGMTLTDAVVDASGATTMDGSITLTANNGTGPYSYDWKGSLAGQTTATVSGLLADDYEVRLSDARGCYIKQDITVDIASSIESIEPASNYFKIMPNPSQNTFYLKVVTHLSSSYDISIIDMLGRTVHQTFDTDSPFISYDVSQIPNGTYLVRLEHETETYTQKLVIQR